MRRTGTTKELLLSELSLEIIIFTYLSNNKKSFICNLNLGFILSVHSCRSPPVASVHFVRPSLVAAGRLRLSSLGAPSSLPPSERAPPGERERLTPFGGACGAKG